MKIKILIPLGCLVLLMSACSRVYSPALYHQDIAYQPKPTSFDTDKDASYISAGLNTYTNSSLNDAVVSGELNLSRGYVFDNFNLAYGAFGTFGDYQNGSSDKTKPYYFGDKFFGAVGGRASANMFVHNDRADFRIIGVEAAYSHEFGDYAAYRQMVYGKPDFSVNPRVNLFTIGLTTEVIFHNQNNTEFQHGIRGFLGTTFGHNPINDDLYSDDTATARMFRNIFPKASYFIKYKDYFGTIEAGSAIFVRFGYKF